MDLETKFARFDESLRVSNGNVIEGYASVFGLSDQGGDIVVSGAYSKSLQQLEAQNRKVRMLWQHDPAIPIGVWDTLHEDARGLFVRGRLLESVEKGREAAALLEAGAIDGLSIGYRTRRASKSEKGQRLLTELDLWEVSLVTFPMMPDARVSAKTDQADHHVLRELTAVFETARQEIARG